MFEFVGANFIRRSRKLTTASMLSTAILIAIAAFILNPIVDTHTEAATGVSNAADTTMSITSASPKAGVAITPVYSTGTFATSSAGDEASFTITTNNYTGYTLSVVAADDDGDLVNVDDDSEYLNSISNPLTASEFSNSSATSLNNKWGFKPSKYMEGNTVVNNTGDTAKYLPSPTTLAVMLDKTTAANNEANSYSIALGARVDYEHKAGTYEKAFTLVAVANPISYTINFNKNTNDTVSNMPNAAIAGETTGTTVALPANVPERQFYTFAGWCNRKDAINVCPSEGRTFQPDTNYGIDQTADNTNITLYALWQPNYYMQDVATWGKNLSIGQSVQAIDRRDNNIYWVTKEETDPANPRAEIDPTTGKAYQIWMTQNLDFSIDSTKTYTHADTDLGYTTNNPNATWTPVRSTLPLANEADWPNDNSSPWSMDLTNAATPSYVYTSGSTSADTGYIILANCVNQGDHLAEECTHYHTGTVYNWTAAIASNDSSTVDTQYAQAPDSICPAGWRLPTGLTAEDGYSDFGYLLNKNGIIPANTYGEHDTDATYTTGGLVAIREAPLWFARSGQIASGDYHADRTAVRYWSSTAASASSKAYDLAFNDSIVYPAGLRDRYWGFAVRCVARAEKTMQNVAAWQDDLAIGESTQAADTRDNKIYWVTKEETDANNPRAEIDPTTGKAYQIWMTQNLDYDLKTTESLIPSTSDVTATWTPANNTLANSDLANWVDDNSNPYSYDGGTKYYYTSGSNEASNDTNVDTEFSSIKACMDTNHTAAECRHYSVGNYYNWSATIASNDGAVISTNVPDSVCPAGWRLPLGNSYGDFAYLLGEDGVVSKDSYWITNSNAGYITDGLIKIRVAPLWLTRSGRIYHTTINAIGWHANYWTSTAITETQAHYFAFHSQAVALSNSGLGKLTGMSVRCIARTTINDLSTLQEFSRLDKKEKENVLKSMEEGVSYQLKDSRDNEVYNVAKLADGKLWLLDNLRLGGNSAINLTPANTNISFDYTLPVNTNSTDQLNAAAQINTGNKNNTMSYGEGDTKIGNYYNYCAASAGTVCGSGYASDAEYDICPAGWRMPIGGTGGDYQALYTAYNDAANAKNALHIVRAGYYNNEVISQGTYGYLWSSTLNAAHDSTAYALLAYEPDGFRAADYASLKYYEFSVRCVMDDTTIDNIATMQDFATLTPLQRKNVLSSMTVGQSYIVTDGRDGEEYNIARLADGQVWLQDNLRLGGDTAIALTPDNTNIASNFTLPASVSSGFGTSSSAQINTDSKDVLVSYGAGNNKVGTYFNYCAASAGTACGNGLEEVSYDVCPKGWRMPTGGPRGEYQNLRYKYGDVADFKNGLHAALSGSFLSSYGGIMRRNEQGRFWSSTKDVINYPNSSIYYVYSVSEEDDHTANEMSEYGNPIRCVLNTSLQDVTNDALNILIPNNGNTITLSDKRDGEKYTIGRLADGRVWFLDNLSLDLSTTRTLTPADTNIATKWTAPTDVAASGYGVYTSPRIYTDDKKSTQTYGNGEGRVGVYYNYCAVSAETYCDADPVKKDNEYDICPAGWRLPTNGSDDGEYDVLYASYSDNNAVRDAVRMPFTGEFYSNRVNGAGGYGEYWASTYHNAVSLGTFTISGTYIIPDSSLERDTGIPVRCIKSN